MTSQTAPTCCSRFQYFLGLILYIGGIGLAAYAYYVEYQLENQPGNRKWLFNLNMSGLYGGNALHYDD